jgi:hypothetical protein
MDTQKSLQWIAGVIRIVVGAGFFTLIISANIYSDLNRVEKARL